MNRSRSVPRLEARLRAAALVIAALCLPGQVDLARAAGHSRRAPGGVLPIDLKAAPTKMLAYGHVKLSGSTGYTGAAGVVTLRIQPPGTAPAIVLTAKVGSDGRFSADFANTTQSGTYAVLAIAPDKKGQATTSFQVVAVEVIPAAFGRSADSLVATAQQALDVVRQGMQGVPASPERAEIDKRLAQLDQRVDGLPAQVAVLTQQMQQVFKARAQVPEDNPQWDAYVARLDDWQTEAAGRSADVRGRIKAASGETQRCGKLDKYNEILTAASEMIGVMSAPFDFTQSFWEDKIPSAFVARALSPQTSTAARFAAIQTMKLGWAAAKGPAALVAAVPGFGLDCAALVLQLELDKYCQKLEGPLSAVFVGESFTKTGEPFLNYTIGLDGRLVLMYDKGASTAKPIGIIGYLEGTGRFKVGDNAKLITRLTPGNVIFHKIYGPPAAPFVSDFSQPARGLLPNSFRVPVKGTLAGDSILLALQPPEYDFDATIEGHSIYVVIPAGGLVPEIIDSRFTLQKAFPILDRVIRRHPVLQMSYVGGTRAHGTFARDTTSPEKTARVRTQLTVQACSPGCLLSSPPKAKQ